jgi:hypothetical protein
MTETISREEMWQRRERELMDEIAQLKKGLLSKKDVDAIALTVVARCKPTMRQVIGDVTPKQYDRADAMAVGIKNAVLIALGEIGLYDPEEQDARTG